jgi:hypothetical protein
MAQDPQTDYNLDIHGPDHEDGKQTALRVSTYKGSNGYIRSTAQVIYKSDMSVSFTVFRDFNKTLINEAGRATQKTLDQQHAKACQIVEDSDRAVSQAFKDEITTHYKVDNAA